MGLGDLLEALLGLLVAGVAVRVVLARQLAVGLLDLLVGGVLAHPEDLVVVGPVSHGAHLLPGHDHARGAQHALAPAVAALVDLDHGAGLGALERLLGHGLVVLGIKRLALGRVRLDVGPLERGDQVGVDVLDPGDQRPVAVCLGGRGVGQRAIEVVDRGQQLERELDRPALLRRRRLPRRPLAVVLELRPRPLRQVQVLVGLRAPSPSAPRRRSRRPSRLSAASSSGLGHLGGFGLLLHVSRSVGGGSGMGPSGLTLRWCPPGSRPRRMPVAKPGRRPAGMRPRSPTTGSGVSSL